MPTHEPTSGQIPTREKATKHNEDSMSSHQQVAIPEQGTTLEESTEVEKGTELETIGNTGDSEASNVQDDDADQKDEPRNLPKQAEETISEARIEEGRRKYYPGGFHPVYIGDVYDNRYEVLNKIGYGVYSTVWLVKNLQQEYVSHIIPS